MFTPESFPEDWARAQHNLAISYRGRLRGERVDNLEQAIHYYEQALTVRTPTTSSEEWAMTQHNLANAYSERLRGEEAGNLEQAISHYEQALTVFTPETFPEKWGITQYNLAGVYVRRLRGERADNLERAISHCKQALTVFTSQSFPLEWATAQHNLASAYLWRLQGERADNLERAIHHYEQALTVFTSQTSPEKWAGTQHNLADAYSKRLQGERADNLERAIHHYGQALTVNTPTTLPQACRNTAYGLGRLLYDERRFSEARHAFDTAHRAVESLRGEIQRDATKRSLADENADLYARLVSCCLKERDEAAAFEYVVTGKGRAFVDLLATARFDLSAASASNSTLADDLYKARELRQQVDNLLAILTGESGLSQAGSSPAFSSEIPDLTSLLSEALRAQLHTLRTQEAHLWDEIAYKYPALTATQKVLILSVDQACTLAAELNASLVEYYQHAEGWCAFVVTPYAMHHISLPLITNNLLERMVSWMLRLEYPIGRNRLSDLRLTEWHDAVIAPLETYLPQGQPIVLAPFGVLHVLPLPAACNRQTKRYVAEDYLIALAPSLSALRVARDQASRTGKDGHTIPHHLLSVAYPGAPDSNHYLPNVLPEAEAIAKHFTQVTRLYQEQATPDAVLTQSHNQDVVHFGCHGWFDVEQPEQSGLMLVGGWLTVQRIITELRLEQARVATLAACLSGRAALHGGDEHVGLLQAILTTGTQAVIASFWSVDDAATRALFETFYAELVAGRSPAKALQEAARSVREQPGWEHPYYWAAFQVSGLAHELPAPEPVPLSTI